MNLRLGSVAVLALLAFLAVAGAPPRAGAQSSQERSARQIRIMEKVIDQVLVESENALVSRGPNCRGVRLTGYGVLFVLELSPIMMGDDILHFRFKSDGSYDVVYGDRHRPRPVEGRTRATGPRTGDDGGAGEDDDQGIEIEDDSGDQAGAPPQPLEDWVKDGDWKHAAEGPARQAALDRVREELVGVLRDYGHTITGIGPDEYVAIAIFPSDLDWRDPATRTVVQVKRRTIDAFNDSALSAGEFAARVEVLTQ